MNRLAAPPSVLLLIPAYNEEANIGRVLAEVEQAGLVADVLVVDDGSTDRTGAIAAAAGANVLSHPSNRGYGAALVSGYGHALANGYDTVVQLDGDGQHDPTQVESLLQALHLSGADMVLGSRMLEGGGHVTSVPRLLGIRCFAWLGRMLLDRPISDPTSGFAAMNRRAVEFLRIHTPADFPDLNVLIGLHRAGIQVIEVPAVMRPRVAGTSQLSGMALFVYVPKMLLYIARAYREKDTARQRERETSG
ncbi:MAG TPA: glycosyltransferase family 2 protein [Terriglobales bacterium]|nr:glycosyltransferase family 2 protein [Terriglobales bacterium]